jgi:hypothetical protein
MGPWPVQSEVPLATGVARGYTAEGGHATKHADSRPRRSRVAWAPGPCAVDDPLAKGSEARGFTAGDSPAILKRKSRKPPIMSKES